MKSKFWSSKNLLSKFWKNGLKNCFDILKYLSNFCQEEANSSIPMQEFSDMEPIKDIDQDDPPPSLLEDAMTRATFLEIANTILIGKCIFIKL